MEKSFTRIGRVFFLKLNEGDHPHRGIEELLESQGIESAWINGIGGFSWARIGVFDPDRKTYDTVNVEPEPGHVLEVVSLLGNSVLGDDGKYYTHLHVNVARNPTTPFTGHLVDAIVTPFLEVMVAELVGDMKSIRDIFKHRWAL
ncbi:MAG: DNA-binding protein [Desulfurococcales archaeon]|nr:DNA-binding protein [Desulfurococcales archaeon]